MRSLFASNGVHALVDGQYGSTGKGALAAYLAERAFVQKVQFNCALYSGGPNSGHTFYHEGTKHVLKQLPTFAVASYLLGVHVPVFLTAGAIIDADVLRAEAEKYPGIDIYVHDNAALVTLGDKDAEHTGSIAAVAGTRSGAGMALASKIMRQFDAIWVNREDCPRMPRNVRSYSDAVFSWRTHRIFMEVSQGFSLGINQKFYPKCTSRECTVSQGISDAGLPPQAVSQTYMSVRTYPIRVGNVDGFSSGGCYDDQEETSWEDLGVEPELTTVTQRVRRVFTWSWTQFNDACYANNPNWVFLNFLNYLSPFDQVQMLRDMKRASNDWDHFSLLGGFGPKTNDIVSYYEA